MKYSILIILSPILLLGQSLSVFDIDTTSFPIMKAKFYAFDASGNQMLNLSPSDFEVTEDSVKRNVTNVYCPSPKPPVPISSVLTIDVSGSMTGAGIGYAKEAAKAWIQALPLGQSECAITSFNSNNYFNQDFTTNRNRLLNGIETLVTSGGRDFNAAFIYPNAGALIASENGKYKKIIILFTDGSADGDASFIINKAKKIGVTIYCITSETSCPYILKEVAEKTGGEWFENIKSEDEAKKVYFTILKKIQQVGFCEIEWESSNSCTSEWRKTNFKISKDNLIDQQKYPIPKKAVSELDFSPKSVYFLNKDIGIQHDTTIILTAINSDIQINDIIGTNPNFVINPKNFTLKNGESKRLILSFIPSDSSYNFVTFDVINDLCQKKYYASGGYHGVKPYNPTLKLTHPNGGENFLNRTDTVIIWEGILPNDTVKIEYSSDNGITWNLITNDATDFVYQWKNMPKQVSNNCIIKITTRNQREDIPVIYWEKNYGTNNDDKARCIRQTSDRGFIVAGSGSNDISILKIAPNGNVEWQKYYGSSDKDNANSIQETYDGGYIFCGVVRFGDGDVTSNFGSSDAWIVKLDSMGNIQWQRNYGGLDDESTLSIVQTFDSCFVVAGLTRSNDHDITINYGKADLWVFKINQKGDILWQSILGGTDVDESTNIALTKDSGFIVTGHIRSNDTGILNKGCSDVWILKFNSICELEWQKTFGGSFYDFSYSIQQTFDGGYILGGYTKSNDGDVTVFRDRKYYSDAWIIKLNYLGNLEWQKTIGGSGAEAIYSIQQTFEGNYLAAGITSSNDGDVVGNKTIYIDYWIFELNPDGSFKWQKILGGYGEDQANSIQQTDDDGFVVAGYSYASEEGEIESANDFWVVRFSPKGIVQQDVSDSVFSIVAPLPTSHDIDMKEAIVNTRKNSIITDFISNSGSWKFRVDSIYFRGTDASAFSLIGGFPKYEVDINKSNFAEIKFAPTEVRKYQAEIVIITQSDTLIQNIYGEGVKEDIAVFGNIIDFGIREISDYKDTTMVLITNNSDNPVDFSSIIMLGPDKDQFEFVSGNTTPLTLNKGESHTMTLRFNPKYIGRTSGQIGFFHNSNGSPALVQLFGAGIGASVSATYDSAYAGEYIDIKINLENNIEKFSSIVGSFAGELRVENTILYPVSGSSTWTNDSVFVPFSGIIDPENQTLAEVNMKAGLGKVETTSIDFNYINWFDLSGKMIDYDTEFISGGFKLLGICREGGTRLFNPDGKVEISAVNPNPAKDEIEIKVNLIEEGLTKIYLTNTLGIKINSVYDELLIKPGEFSFDISTSEISSGVYFLVLETPTVRKVEKLIIEK